MIEFLSDNISCFRYEFWSFVRAGRLNRFVDRDVYFGLPVEIMLMFPSFVGKTFPQF